MARQELKDSGVVLIEDTHTYLLGHKDLQGITSTLIPAIFGDYTASIPDDILERAAARGKKVHDDIQMMEEGFDYESYEVNAYKRLRDALGLRYVANEYIVTDGTHFASPIDIVFEDDIIADIKTTQKLHYPEVTFQLSWYAAHYEALNGRKVQKAYVIHLPKEQYGGGAAEEITLVPAATIKEIVQAYLAGEDVTRYGALFGVKPAKTPVIASDLPVNVQEAVSGISTYEQQIKALDAQIKGIKAKRDKLTEIALDYFHTSGETKIEGDLVTIIYIEPTIRTGVDSKTLKKDHPDIFEQYKTETVVRESIRINVKQ